MDVSVEGENEISKKNIVLGLRLKMEKSCRSFYVAKKLNDNRGASIVVALVVFMIAALFSMVIVNAALNNAQRIRRQRYERQAMLAVASAAPIVERIFGGCSAYASDDGSYTIEFSDELTKTVANEEGAYNDSGSIDSLKTEFQQIISLGQKDGAPVFKLEVNSADNVGGKLDVDVYAKADEEHNVTVTIKSNGGYENPGSGQEAGEKISLSEKTIYFPALEIRDESGKVTSINW